MPRRMMFTGVREAGKRPSTLLSASNPQVSTFAWEQPRRLKTDTISLRCASFIANSASPMKIILSVHSFDAAFPRKAWRFHCLLLNQRSRWIAMGSTGTR